MDRTIRLFDEKPYLTKYEANIVSCENEGGHYLTVLDVTIFFPEQGGQSPDKGLLGGQEVTDVQNRDGVIIHVTKEKPESGLCELDWQHRFSNMQQHTGEHIFSGLTKQKYGYENVGFHLSYHVVTLDTSGPLKENQLTELENEVNRVITENHAVRAFYPDPGELDKYDYRSKDGIEGDVRLVEIEGVDLCACCAPHVKNTGEIGIFKIVSYERYKGGTRITFLCGTRALELFRRDERILKELSGSFSCKPESIAENVEKLREEKYELAAALKKTEGENLQREIAGLKVDITSPILFTTIADAKLLRDTVNTLMEQYDGFSGIFFGQSGSYNFVIGSAGLDCNEIMKVLREAGAKGGGSARMIQGTINLPKKEIEEIWDRVADLQGK